MHQTLETAIESAKAAEAQTQQDWGVWEYEGVFFAAPCALHRYGDGALFDTMKHWEHTEDTQEQEPVLASGKPAEEPA